jgi:predicted DNA-binding protein (MmcQ/YjbR family)
MNAKQLEKICGAWPGVTHDIKWKDDLVYSVGAKMFVVLAIRGEHEGQYSFKVDAGRFLEFTDQAGIIPAPYMAKNSWICIVQDKALSIKEASLLIRRSYELVRAKLTKKLQASLKD